MTIGRLLTDRIVARVGSPAFVRGGALVAAVGLSVVALAANVPVVLVGWTVFGIGGVRRATARAGSAVTQAYAVRARARTFAYGRADD